MAAKNKIRFGLKNVYYSIITEDESGNETWGTPKAWKGAVSLTIDADGGVQNFAADDNAKYASFNDSNGATGTLTMAYAENDVLKDLLNYTVDTTSGAIGDNPDAETVRFALIFECSSNTKNDRYIYHDCVLSEPSTDANTRSDSTDPDTQEFEISMAIHDFGTFRRCHSRVTEGDAGYSTWFTTAYVPTAA